MVLEQWSSAKHCTSIQQRTPPIFRWAAITLDIDPHSTLCLKKVPTFELSVTLSNLNRFSKFYTAEKGMKFATKLIRQCYLTLGTFGN